MYAVYTACKEYAGAVTALAAAEKALTKQLSSSYEALVTARNAYYTLSDTLTASREALKKVTALNKLGKAEYSEVKDKQNDYEQMQLETIDTLAAYNELLYAFERLTCGGATKYLQGVGISTRTGAGGDSYAEVDRINEPYYYINTEIENMVFVFGVSIPDDFEPEITHFEIWYEGVQIGERTPISRQLRHLALDYGETNELTVRFFNDTSYVDQCVIDTSVARDVLKLKGAVIKTETEKKVGTYTVTTSSLGRVSTSALTITPDRKTGIAYFSIAYGDGKTVFTPEPVPVEDSFTYLTLLIQSLDGATLTLYDADKEKLYTGRFDTAAQTVMAVLP
ncbi:hypothetical protein SDC9_97882 [bioreactor metagenome]|uniref:Uncharacterized protein n=1 Tax=bioreactor metagenome TaxID=1076179 RepID=A0A645AD52_9ZZZZ